jgi:DNA invertase Pin-like site-specific DNA recombinase
MKKVVIYARVSTNVQDYDHQLVQLREYARKMNYEVVKEFSEKISGAKRIAERQALTELLAFVDSNKVDKVLVFECSRLSRQAIDFLSVIEHFNTRKVSVVILQSNLETLMEDGSINPTTQLILGIMGQFNSMERSLIRSRMESGYNNYRLNGGKVGRKEGYRKSDEQMKQQYTKEIQLLRKGLSLRNIQAITSTSINTLRKLKNMLMAS